MSRIGLLASLFFAAVVIGAAVPARSQSAAVTPVVPAAATPAVARAKSDDSFEKLPLNRPDAPPAVQSTDGTVQIHGTTFDPTRVMLALLGVVGLILLLRGVVRKMFPGAVANRASRAIKVLSRCTISPRQHLLLIQVGKRLLVVGDSGTQLNPLCEITDGEEASALLAQLNEESAAAAWRFDALFGRARKDFNEPAPTDEPDGAIAPGAQDSTKSETPFDPTHEINDPSIIETRKELDGLSDKVRDLARQLGGA